MTPGGPSAATGRPLRAEGLRKTFAGAASPALDGVDFHVAAGEFVSLVGPSGCGKTTLLRVVAGLEIADSGTVRLGDAALDPLPARLRPVNTVFQGYALFPHLTAFENVAFGLRSRRVSGAEIGERVRAALELVRLDGLASRRPHELSGGQRQRVALARAFVNEPEVLLLDEPMSALDARLRAEVRTELRAIQRRLGRAFVLVTHDREEAFSVSDRIAVMLDGRIVQEGAPEEIHDRPRTRFVAEFLADANLVSVRAEGERAVRCDFGLWKTGERVPFERGTIALHPERIRIAGQGSDATANRVAARVRERRYAGDRFEIVCEPGGLRVRGTGAPPGIGEAATLEIPNDAIRFLRD